MSTQFVHDMSSQIVFFAHGDPNMEHPKKPPNPHKPSTSKLSFREKLLGSSHEDSLRAKEDMIKKKLVRIELKYGNRLLPKFYLESKVFQE